MITISGKVIHGDGYGKVLGFPTANLDRREYLWKKMKVKFGVYSGISILSSGKKYKAGITIGPIDSKGLPKLEAYLIGFSGNLYGKKITIILQKYLRGWINFGGNEEALKKQLQKDILKIKNLFK